MNTQLAESRVPGFANPVRDAQHVFRAVLEAFARPTTPQRVDVEIQTPEPLGMTAGAVILALCDEQTPVWLDHYLRESPEVGAWIAFHTGARIVDRAGDALFVIASSPSTAPRLADLLLGTDEEPHRSATLVIGASAASDVGATGMTRSPGIAALVATGPGIQGAVDWDGAGLPDGFVSQWQQNRALFPRGVDIVLAADSVVRGLPRTTALIVAGKSTGGNERSGNERTGSEHVGHTADTTEKRSA
ncbi:alpha-D-ribose 1-methylphosphonate 5-triphosphate synthase subunit PhnH [Glaciihabitans tibetensis]|uniref:Alpha-D-ribose 1-methylphosphonate 5-triphosphate synthase subunit PhnH n=1 Tax=Glaciihabitans tibetensis TaxID=1266600 RepID=A0A2T0VEQ5_9MICO|nr:phosphonate C-P lyase system protein PhnH [Glaciihabitans tibetensis]PRY68620.1 alpha-D-ribose 1-methylphosphonate 5-triphosphate synthase subunit PhnH [Glaciihabitans tibetensis]